MITTQPVGIQNYLEHYGPEFCELMTINSTYSLFVHTKENWHNLTSDNVNANVWLIQDGISVAMLSFLTKTVGKERVSYLCDIEVREEYRGNKLAVTLIRYVNEKVSEKPLVTTGHYTPEGFKYLHGLIPLAQESLTATGENSPSVGVCFKSQNFVADWEQMRERGW